MKDELAKNSKFPHPYFCSHPKWRYFILTTVLIGATMSALDVSIANVALPTIQNYFHTSLSNVEWVAMAYMVTLTALLPFFGRLADMYGRTRMYNIGFVVFTIGSALCGAAFSITMLAFSRALQAIGAGLLQSNSVAIITDAFPKEELGRAIGLQGAVQATAMALGAFLGGAIVSAIGWRYIFYVNVPIGIIGTFMAMLVLPKGIAKKKEKIDYAGAILFSISLLAFLFALNKGSSYGWTSSIVITLFGITIICLPLFFYNEIKNKTPMIKLSIFKSWGFTVGNFTGFLSYLIFFSVLFLMPYYLEMILHYDPLVTGTLLTPIPVAMAIMAPIAGYVSDKVGRRLVTTSGFIVISLAIFMLLLLQPNTSFFFVTLSMVVLGLGMGLFTPPNNSEIMLSVSPENRGVAGGILNMMRSLGLAVGVDVVGLVFSNIHYNYIHLHFHELSYSAYKHLWGNYQLFIKTIPRIIVVAAFMKAFYYSVLVLLVLSVIGVVFSILKSSKKKNSEVNNSDLKKFIDLH
jgi:EmrB/QacA subfamily drug resistance transporter